MLRIRPRFRSAKLARKESAMSFEIAPSLASSFAIHSGAAFGAPARFASRLTCSMQLSKSD
jgi:hypothetical protein